MDLDELARDYLAKGYSGAADGALITPNGYQHRGLIKSGVHIFMPEQIGWKIRDMQEAKAHRSDQRRDLRGLVLTQTMRNGIGH